MLRAWFTTSRENPRRLSSGSSGGLAVDLSLRPRLDKQIQLTAVATPCIEPNQGKLLVFEALLRVSAVVITIIKEIN